MPVRRLYSEILTQHLAKHRQMIFLSGPRQVGKTTLAKTHSQLYLNFEDPAQRRQILDPIQFNQDIAAWMAKTKAQADAGRPVLALDELHKHSRWRAFLKGVFDPFEPNLGIIVTGSAKLEILRRGGDSLMGRYLLHRVHPLTLGELLHGAPPPGAALWHAPIRPDEATWQALLRFGGFPEPFTKQDSSFSTQWQDHRRDQLLNEDLRDLTRIRELSQVESLSMLLNQRSAQALNYSHLSGDVGSNVVSVRQWVKALANLHHGFTLSPYSKKLATSLRREPKWYSRDWSTVLDEGARFETMVANHLLKAVELWTDMGKGRFDLQYIRTRQHEEVDFLVTRDQKPWLLVEAKHSDKALSRALVKFHTVLGTEHAVQIVQTQYFEGIDAFSTDTPKAVSGRDFLSQLP